MGASLSRLQRGDPPEAGEGPLEVDQVQALQQRDSRAQRHLWGDVRARHHEDGGPVNEVDNALEGGRRRGKKRKRRGGGRKTTKRAMNRAASRSPDSDLEASSSGGESVEEFDEILHTPKKRKLRTTSRYIFEMLFLEGRESDVTVKALNREWKLHKLYLCQSLYFQSMFSGSWKESNMTTIEIQVADPNVTLDALHVALGSLYQDEITVEPADVIHILAAANLFQLEGLIDQCNAIMEETVNVKTVVRYYETSITYGAGQAKDSCLSWLKVNLLSHMPEHPDRLREISPDLMAILVGSPELFVMQTEFSVYVLLRLWLYLLFHEAWDGNPQDAVLKSHRYFQERVKTTKTFFLETEEGSPYVKVFRNLRLTHLVNHHMDMEMLLADRIIARKWMFPVYQNQWRLLLRTDQGIDKGPQHLTQEEFDRVCLRCGRTLNVSGQQHMWRWTGFGMGLDLIVTYTAGYISLKRNLGTATSSRSASGEHEALLSNHKKRHVYYRVTVASLNDQKQVTYRATSGIQSVSLARNASHELLKVDVNKAAFPLLLSFNFVVNTPLSESNEDEEEELELDAAAADSERSPSGQQNQGAEADEAVENNVVEVPP